MNSEVVEVAQDAAEAAVSAKGLGSTLTGGAVALYGGLSANDWAVVLGVVLGIGGLMVQIWDKYHAHQERKVRLRALAAREKREIAQHKAEMAEYARTGRMPLLELPVLDSLTELHSGGGIHD